MAFPFIVILLLLLSLDPNVKKDMRTEGEQVEVEEKDVSYCVGLREVVRLPQYIIAVLSLSMQTLTAFVSFVHLVSQVSCHVAKGLRVGTVLIAKAE